MCLFAGCDILKNRPTDEEYWTCRLPEPVATAAHHAGSSELQGAAADTIAAIISKRMDPLPKLQLVMQLGVVPVAAEWEAILSGGSAGEGNMEAAARLSALLNVLALEVIESVKRLENHVISMQVCTSQQAAAVGCVHSGVEPW
jgi:hypothetical protein